MIEEEEGGGEGERPRMEYTSVEPKADCSRDEDDIWGGGEG